MATISGKALRAALKHIRPFVAARRKIPILSCVRVQKADGASQITITGTDLDVEVMARLEDVGSGPGGSLDCIMQLSTLARIAAVVEGDVALNVKGDDLLIKADDMSMTLNQLLPVEDFPMMEKDFDKPIIASVSAPEAALKRYIGRVQPCISTEKTRYYLNGVYFHAPKGKCRLRLVATDGRKLALYATDIAWNHKANCIVPTKTVASISRMISDKGNKSVAIKVVGMNIEFDVGDYRVRSKVIDGTYPDYTRTIPQMPDGVKISVPITADAVRRMVRLHGGTPAVEVRPDDAEVQIRDVINGLTVTAPLHGARGEKFGMNFRNIAMMMGQDEIAVLESDGPGNPFLLKTEDKNYTGVAMPMRVRV